jgi:hypothetical protein
MRNHARLMLAMLSIIVTLIIVGPTHAGEGEWSFKLEGIYMNAYGHDQHVLTIHEIDSDLQMDDKTAINLEVDADLAYRAEAQYNRGKWGAGIELLWFMTSHTRQSHTAAADGTIDEVVFELAGREIVSEGPDEVLYYNVLEDTDLATWSVDIYGIRTLLDNEGSSLDLQFGLRQTDFDNDYRAVAGIQDDSGVRLDGSSNYGAMYGPRIGLAGRIKHGRNNIEGYFGQAVILGSTELGSMSRAFTGTPDAPVYTDQWTLHSDRDVAIPVTEFRLKWTYSITKNIAAGVGANTSAWWDVPVPPGVIPGDDGHDALHENTIVFFGMLGAVEFKF